MKKINNISTSILVIDDEISFQQPLYESFEREIEYNPNFLDFAENGLKGLKEAREIMQDYSNDHLLIIDMVLPDIPGEKIIEAIEKERDKNSRLKAVVISANVIEDKLKEITEQHNWIIDYLPKPIDIKRLKTIVFSLYKEQKGKFNYDDLDPEVAQFVREQTARYKGLLRKSVMTIIEIGELLMSVKDRLQHGQFQTWIESELGCHYNTAYKMMKVGYFFGPEKEQVANSELAITAFYTLVENTDDYLRETILEINDTSRKQLQKPLTIDEIRAIKEVYNEQKQKSKNPKDLQQAIKKLKPAQIKAAQNPAHPNTKTKPNKKTIKQQIIKVLPKNVKSEENQGKFWKFNKHLLFCGQPESQVFLAKIPKKIDLIIAFPPSEDWDKTSILPVKARSTLICQTEFKDLNLRIIREMIYNALELYTENGSNIMICFLPDFNILNVAVELGCYCFIAEPSWEKCQKLVELLE